MAPGRLGVGETSETAFRVPPEAIGYWTHRLVSEAVEHESPTRVFGETVLRFRDPDRMRLALVATDGLTRLYGIPGRTASAIRRFGMGAVQRLGPVKDRLMAEARGESGDMPLLLRGLTI